MDRSALVLHVQQRRLEAHAFAFFAGQFDVGEELHFFYLDAVALAALASAARHVEAEVRRIEAVRLRFAGRCEQVADRIVDLDVSDRIRTRRAAYRGLIHQHDVIHVLRAVDLSE